MVESKREEEDTGERMLSRFADHFATCAGTIISNTGWVSYVIGPELRIKHFLICNTNGAERADYEANFAHLDPLSPMHCIARQRFVACLHDELSTHSPDHLAYRQGFMQPHRIVDALEMILRSESGICVGISLIRHHRAPEFSALEQRQADALRGLGDFMLSRLLPTRLTGVDFICERFPAITPREATLMQLVLMGLSNKQICRELSISLPTVKSHLFNVFRKTNVHSRTELIARLLR
ncbi:LuxR family transcriptional regulator [Thauera phenylacetica B4P]|uniref:LuxR family transcriptional regulator n=1 Tax=Thauera phenylacetica B4P TaxID=1234382 RepID=N6YTA4_9RHOO|nr:LuxR C-terminal-related transcriptional regulator [Thauera phenylacetica]ENO97506.1 LuxR family transcriptional regulator [Thauera phenylacetica B4P]